MTAHAQLPTTSGPSVGASGAEREALRTVLRLWEPAAGPDGFEGLVARALASLSGHTFRLARSGSQFGRDAATPIAPFAIAMEAKRYSDTVPLQELLGKASLAAFALADGIDVWVLAATVEISEPTQRTLEQALDAAGISLLTLDWTEAGLPPLAVLLASARPAILPWAATRLDAKDYSRLEEGLLEIGTSPAFEADRAKLLAQLSSGSLGLDPFRQRNAEWCAHRFSDRRQAQSEFSQFLSPLEAPAKGTDRPLMRAAIERAVEVARGDARGETVVAVLGGEGAGKSWAVAKWWLADAGHPILLLSVGRIADRLSADEEPVEMLARLAAHQEGRRDSTAVARWRRRIERWSEGSKPRNRFIVFLDGLNETSGKPWAGILRTLMPAVHAVGGIVIATCRDGYWDREVADRIQFVQTEKVPVGDYDDGEFAEVMRSHGVPIDGLPARLDRFMRNPRICALALTLLPDLSGIGDLGVERLLMEYWRARLRERGDLLGHNDRDFRNLLIHHARDYRARPGTDFDRDEWRSRSGAARRADGRNLGDDLSDIEEGRFFDSEQGAYRFRPEALRFALGLLVADELRSAVRDGDGNAREALEDVIGSVRGFEVVTDVLTAAIAIATLDADYPDRGIAGLVVGWMSLQNQADDAIEGLVPYLAARPDPFLDAFEEHDPGQGGRFLGLLLAASRRPSVAAAIEARVNKWLGSWSRAPEVWGNPGERPRLRQEREALIERRLSELRDDERTFFTENCVEMPNSAGLAEAAALYMLGENQSAFARGLVAFGFAHTIAGDHRSPFKDVAWTVRLNRADHDRLGARLREETAPFAGPGASALARAATACTLRLHGSLRGQIEAEGLSPRTMPAIRLGNSQFDHLDPSKGRPEGMDGVVERVRKIDPAAFWNQMGRTVEDHELEKAVQFMARFTPAPLVSLMNRVAETVASREGLALRQLSWRLPWLSPILSVDAVEAIRRRIADLLRHPSLVADEDGEFVTGMLVESIMPLLDAASQLDLLRSLPPHAPFYLRYSAVAKPLPDADVERCLNSAMSAHPRVLERTLLFLAATLGNLTVGSRTMLESCLASDEPDVRAAAAELARRCADTALDDAVLALPLPADGDRSWRATVVGTAFAGAVVRRDRYDLLHLVPAEHLDWVAARMPAARPYLVDAIGLAIERLASPASLDEPTDADVLLQVGEDPSKTMVDLVDKGERFDDPISELKAGFGNVSNADFARRRAFLRGQLDRFLDSLANEDMLSVARRPYMVGLDWLAREGSERFAGWLRTILAVQDPPALRRLRNLGFALATNFSSVDPGLVARVLEHRWRVHPHVTVQCGLARHSMSDLVLFGAAPSAEIDALRARALKEARDDGRIGSLVLAAEEAGSRPWLDTFVDACLSSSFPADQALGITVASFRHDNSQSEEVLQREWHHGFLGETAGVGRDRYRAMKHARHWFSLAANAADLLDTWRFIELGIVVADGRELGAANARLFAELDKDGFDMSQRLAKAAGKVSGNARKTLFGNKVPAGPMGFVLGS